MPRNGFQIEELYPEPDTFTREEYMALSEYAPEAAPSVDDGQPPTVDYLERMPSAWKTKRRCLGVDPGLFFPESGDSKGAELARDICRSCVVIAPCLDEVLLTPRVPGIVAATSEKERRKLRKQRGLSH